MQNDTENEYFTKAEEVVAQNLDNNPFIRLGQLMPWLIPFLTYIMIGQLLLQRLAHKIIPSVEELARFWLMDRLIYLIDLRTSSKHEKKEKKQVDLLQIMLDAATKDEVKVSRLMYKF